MPDQRDRPLFLAQRGYRQRRVIDAACLLPVFGAFLLLVPVLWDVGGGAAGSDAGAEPRLAERGVYIFAVWGLLVLAAAILGRRLRQAAAPPQASDTAMRDAPGSDVAGPAVGSHDMPGGTDATGAPGGP